MLLTQIKTAHYMRILTSQTFDIKCPNLQHITHVASVVSRVSKYYILLQSIRLEKNCTYVQVKRRLFCFPQVFRMCVVLVNDLIHTVQGKEMSAS